MDNEQHLKRRENIRNFPIVAHTDHGKSTLVDGILENAKSVEIRDMRDQLLDSMGLEREHGITIKLNAVRLKYEAKDGNTYTFRSIDTSGHVDFTYEVLRSLAACEDVILVVNAAQGIETQTLANVYLALDNELGLLPVINKTSLSAAEPECAKQEVEDMIGLDQDDVVLASAKSSIGTEEILEEIVEVVPVPDGDPEALLKALIFDSEYDSCRGVILSIKIVDSVVKAGDKIRMMATGKEFEVTEVGINTPKQLPVGELTVGGVGHITISIKNVDDLRVGDTITLANRPVSEPLQGYKKMDPMIHCGLSPIDNKNYNDLREALEKLQLNDTPLELEPKSSQVLGFGYRTGFLGMLHMEIAQERVERGFGIELIVTTPPVIYQRVLRDGPEVTADNPVQMPDRDKIDKIFEPYIRATMMVPNDYVSVVMELYQRRRGQFISMDYLDDIHVNIVCELPLAEIVFDFFDRLKSSTKGYASFDYEFTGNKESNLVKVDVLLNGDKVDALSLMVHKDSACERGKVLIEKLKTLIPRQQSEVPVQAAIGQKIVTRTNIKPMDKNVLARCYGGDISRKRRLLEKQKADKAKMKAVGNVEIPQDAFLAVSKMDDE